MPWLLLLLGLGALVLAFVAQSIWLVALGLLAALALLLAGVMGLMARRLGSRSRDETLMIDPAELRRLREQAEARRNAAQADRAPPTS